MKRRINTELRVLIIEDCESDAALILRELERHAYTIVSNRVDTAADLRKALTENWDVILSDFRLPQLNAMAALEVLHSFDRDIPFIVISQAIGEDLAVELMRAGASDYLMKSSLARLMPAIEREIREAKNRAEARLQAVQLEMSERNFRLLAEHAADMISRHAPDGTFIYVSPAFERILGYRPEEQIGHSAFEFIHPADLPVVKVSYQAVTGAVVEERAEYRLRKKDGNYIWAQSISRSRADGTGKITEIQIATRDITTEKMAQNALLASEERYRTLTTELQVGVLIQGPQSEIILGNPKAFELLGLTAELLLSKKSTDPDWNVIDENGAAFPGAKHPVPLAIKTGKSVRSVVMGVYRASRDDRVWLLVDATPQLNPDGSVRQVICTFSDITDRKRAEEAARDNEAIFRSIIELSPVPYALNDDHGNIIYLNKAFIKTFGYTNSDIPTLEHWWPLAYPDPDYRRHVAEDWQARLEVAKLSGDPFEVMELQICCKNKSQRTVLASAGQLGKSYNGIHLVILYDITERKENEQKILALSQQLMNISELERSEIAGELHDVVGQSLVLLKLNTIQFLQANSLRSAANEELLLQPVAETLQTIREISRRLTPSHMKKIGLVAALEDMLQGAVKHSGIRIVCDLAAVEEFFPENWNIQVYRIVQESLTNVLKHSGATELKVTAKRLDENLEVIVADNGRGLSGTPVDFGLGLSIMRERVRGLRGHLFFEETNPGLAIHVLFPSQALSA